MNDTCLNTGSATTVYADLVSRLRDSIVRGALKPGGFVGTEQEFCREWKLSRVSVRRATSLLIDEGLIERRPGKGLFVRLSDVAKRTIQIIVPDLAFEQCVQIARGAQSLGLERGFTVQVYDANNRMDRDIAMLDQMPDQAIDGALILSWHNPKFTEALLRLKQNGVPFVLVDEHPRDIEVSSVTADNYAGGLRVGNALVDLGHKHVGFVGNLVAGTVRARLEGLRDAIGDRKLPFDRSCIMDLAVQPNDDWAQRIASCTRELMSRADRPTAIFYSDDQVAAEGYRTLRSMGLRVPDDVSIVGFDDSPLCRWLEPALASVRQPSMEMGRAAMRMLLDGIAHQQANKTPAPMGRVTLPVEWLPRASVGKAPQ